MITNNKNQGFTPIKQIIADDIFKVRGYPIDSFDYIIDIGANLGVFSLLTTVLYPEARIFAYEPCKETYGYLVKNANGFNNIECFQLALGDGSDLYLSEQKDHTENFFTEKSGKTKTKTKKLSDMVKDIGIDIDNSNYLIKMNVEGGEKFLLTDNIYNVVKNCNHFCMSIHFQSLNGWNSEKNDNLLTYNEYYEWTKQFESTHNVLYYKSRKSKGYGHYILRKKTTL